MYNSKQGHMNIPVHFLWYQKFHVPYTFPRSRTYDIYCTFPVATYPAASEILYFTFTRQGLKDT